MRIYLTAALLFFQVQIFSQQEMPLEPVSNESPVRTLNNLHGVGEKFSIGEKLKVFGDKINVRNAPQASGSVVAQLSIGEEVQVLDTAQFWQLNGIRERWLEVSFSSGGKSQKGFVWGGLLALGHAEIEGVLLLFGQTSAGEKAVDEEFSKHQFECRAAEAGSLLATLKVEETVLEEYYAQTSQLPNLGLSRFKGALKIYMGFDACGYPSFEIYVFWDGKNLVPLPTLSSVGDGGVFYHSESYIFPFQQPEYDQEKQLILLKTEHMEVVEGDDLDLEMEYDEWTKVRIVNWDGRQFLKPNVD